MGRLASVVEGPGDRALRGLLDRLLPERLGCRDWQVLAPQPAGGHGALTRPGGLERFVEFALRATPRPDAVLFLLDGDVLPAGVRPLAARLRAQQPPAPLPIAITVAQPAFATWLVARIDTTAAKLPGSPRGLRCPPNVEALAHPDRWLAQQVRRESPKQDYRKTRDQAPMAALLDYAAVERRSASFAEFLSTVTALIQAANQGRAVVLP